MNPTGDSTEITRELLFLRFQQPFVPTLSGLFGVRETWMVLPLVALVLVDHALPCIRVTVLEC